MSNEYKDWIQDDNIDMRNCLCETYKTLDTLYHCEMRYDEPNQVVIDIILENQNKIRNTLGYTEEEILNS